MRFRLDLEYEGTRYRGWQVQPGQRTVQGELLRAVEELLGEPPEELVGAGRTDAGVHALGQVAHLECRTRLSPRELEHGLNDRLPADIAVLGVQTARRDFHARHTASSRSYLYQISRRRTAFGKKLVWWVKDRLDLEAMQASALEFRGMQDMAGFCAEPTGETRVLLLGTGVLEEEDLILVRVHASHFLWRMVRQMVGCLVEAGRGRLGPVQIREMLSGRARGRAELTVPPAGLFLERVLYPGEAALPEFRPVLGIRSFRPEP